ncbi:DNA-methyltransferase [Tautonia plasticadhaerens]|uniref:Methyltransferase n=1 Tax=Tautonia plasticadhaerens TaxID=2527974 RepID=A0A518H7Y1_9BACT|nr:site-specific DNA-methyltransferase [Tautonia plasticadhaerens]QDV36978.1 DNA adenine methyltransferase YhdJ [Tautonia plasticadhaerens]
MFESDVSGVATNVPEAPPGAAIVEGGEFTDRICCVDAVSGMEMLPDGCVPMTLTSPPYDGHRVYGGHRFDHETFGRVARELWRVTMPGGVVVWVVADEIRGGHTGTSFRQALHFQEIGFRLHDILVMARTGGRWFGVNHYGKVEYAFVLSKGRPRSVHLLRDRPNKHAGKLYQYRARRRDGGQRMSPRFKTVPAMGLKGPVWEYLAGFGGTTRDRYAFEHPALMPEAMATDHIVSWSRPGDLILDPFLGSGTTAKMALLNHRHYLGFEAHRPYYRLAVRRMRDAHAEYRRRLDAWLAGA